LPRTRPVDLTEDLTLAARSNLGWDPLTSLRAYAGSITWSRRLQKLLQQFSKRPVVSKRAHEALDALRARTAQHGLGELEILGPQLGIRKRIFGIATRTGRFRSELATVVQRDLHARPSLGRKQPRKIVVLGQDHEAEQAPNPRVRELWHIDLLVTNLSTHQH